MGGTSTDVSRFEDHYEMEYETEKAGVRVVAPMMAIEPWQQAVAPSVRLMAHALPWDLPVLVPIRGQPVRAGGTPGRN